MDADELRAEGRFLRAEQCGEKGIRFTIEYALAKQNVSSPGEPPRKKGVLYSSNGWPPFVLNEVNRLKIVELLGPNVDQWTGRTIECYKANNILFKGGLTSGIRVRAPGNGPNGNDEKPAPVRPRPPLPLSQPTSKSVDEINAELAAEFCN